MHFLNFADNNFFVFLRCICFFYIMLFVFLHVLYPRLYIFDCLYGFV